MKVYLIAPGLTIGLDPAASTFYGAYRLELEGQVETSTIASESALCSTSPDEGSIIVYFNKHEGDPRYSQPFLDFMRAAIIAQCEIFPIAITYEHRRPPELLAEKQSYDVHEKLRERRLEKTQVETVATAFSRQVLARLQPTLCVDDMTLFLSYRRFDGENIAAAIHDLLTLSNQNVFRDLNKVLVGKDAQDEIEKNLRASNAVVFLDTPKSGESEWIARELRYALALNLPIIWVRFGPDESRAKLPVSPADKPHFVFEKMDVSDEKVNASLVEDIIHRAFQAYREHATRMFSQLRRMQFHQHEGRIELEVLDKKRLEYEVKIPRENGRYMERPLTHVIGLYTKKPSDAEHHIFKQDLERIGYSCHPRAGCNYDAAFLLTSIPMLSGQKIEDYRYTDSFANYIDVLERRILPKPETVDSNNKGIIISGAFPDCEPQYQQNVTNAVHAFAAATLNLGYTVIFGSHPTFQHLIFDTARIRRPDDYASSIRMYISRYFTTDQLISELKDFATVIATDELTDRAESLTLMRKEMISDPLAGCMIVIGGKGARPNVSPGVDEEIELALARKLPVYLVGSAGGRAAELAMRYSQEAGCKLNNSSVELNRELLVSVDYSVLAMRIFRDVFGGVQQ